VSDLGSSAAIGGGVVAVIAGVLLVAFFATGREALGRANDAASALMTILLIPAAVAVNERFADTGAFVPLVTGVGVIALAETTVASLLTAAGRLTMRQLLVWQGGGFGVLFAWVLGVSVAALWLGRLPPALGYVGLAASVCLVVAVVEFARLARRLGGWAQLAGLRSAPPIGTIAMLGAFFGLPVWCIVLGLGLAERIA
jgi:putative effector of murein hydrolase LrgA (UPF0299 family)